MTTLVSLIPVILLAIFLCIRMPIAFALGMAGVVGVLMHGGWHRMVTNLGSIPYNATAKYTLALIPLFLLMGLAVSHSGMVNGIFSLADRVTRRIPGGVGVATILASTFFGAVSGSSVANAATIGRVSIVEMDRRGYDKAFAGALVASVGTIAILIPPSIALVIYGILAQESIGRLLLAGIIPGLITMVVYVIFVMWLSRKYVAPKLDSTSPDLTTVEEPSFNVAFGSIAGTFLFLTVMGGIYSGVFTSTEAGAVGAALALILAIIFVLVKRGEGRGDLRRMLGDTFSEVGTMTAMLFALIVGSSIFSYYMVTSGLTSSFVRALTGLLVAPLMILILILVAMIPLGMVMDGMSMLLIVVPITYPIISALGLDGIWFGILLIKMIEIGLLTPPVGLNVFVISGIVPSLPVESVFRRITPFILAEFVVVAILVAFPDLVLWLPNLAGNVQ